MGSGEKASGEGGGVFAKIIFPRVKLFFTQTQCYNNYGISKTRTNTEGVAIITVMILSQP